MADDTPKLHLVQTDGEDPVVLRNLIEAQRAEIASLRKLAFDIEDFVTSTELVVYLARWREAAQDEIQNLRALAWEGWKQAVGRAQELQDTEERDLRKLIEVVRNYRKEIQDLRTLAWEGWADGVFFEGLWRNARARLRNGEQRRVYEDLVPCSHET